MYFLCFFSRIFVNSILKSLDCSKQDGEGFFALCLLYTILTNKGKFACSFAGFIDLDIMQVFLLS